MVASVQSSLDALRKAATKGKTKKSVSETISNLSSSLVLLNSSSPSSLTFNKLVTLFRAPFVPLYTSYPQHALQLAATILKRILKEKLVSGLREDKGSTFSGPGSAEIYRGWEKTANSLLSGVLDFLENEETDASKSAIASVFYSPLCEFFFPRAGSVISNLGVDVRGTAYTLLSDTAGLHEANQATLRDSRKLGAKRLGMAIGQTKDFAVLEILLTLFARLLPSSTSSRAKRTSFIKEVFVSPQVLPVGCGKAITDLLEDVAAKDWEVTSAKIIDVLANSDLRFPQPFDVKEVLACGVVFPQPEAGDRLYIDRKAFFVNVALGDGLYESLQIYFGTVQSIVLSSTSLARTTKATVTVSSQPLLADRPMKQQAQSNPTGQPPGAILVVEITNEDLSRFTKVLRQRGMGELFKSSEKMTGRAPRVSVTKGSAHLEHDDGERECLEPPTAKSKVKDVEKFYNTAASDDLPHSEDVAPSLDTVAQSIVPGHSTHSISEPASRSVINMIVTEEVHVEAGRFTTGLAKAGEKGRRSLKPTASDVMRTVVFGTSDEELSEVAEPEFHPTVAHVDKVKETGKATGVKVSQPTPLQNAAKKAKKAVPTKNSAKPFVNIICDDEDEGQEIEVKKTKRSSAATKSRAIVLSDNVEDPRAETDLSPANIRKVKLAPMKGTTTSHAKRGDKPEDNPATASEDTVEATSKLVEPVNQLAISKVKVSVGPRISKGRTKRAILTDKTDGPTSALWDEFASTKDQKQPCVALTDAPPTRPKRASAVAASIKMASNLVGANDSETAVSAKSGLDERPTLATLKGDSRLDKTHDASVTKTQKQPTLNRDAFPYASATMTVDHDMQLETVNSPNPKIKTLVKPQPANISTTLPPIVHSFALASVESNTDSSSRSDKRLPALSTTTPLASATQKAGEPKAAPKRKRHQRDDTDERVEADTDKEQPPNKKTHLDVSALPLKPADRSESQVLRPRNTGATRATHRYGHRGRQDKTSSPSHRIADIDWDEVPSDLPAAQPELDYTEMPASSPIVPPSPPQLRLPLSRVVTNNITSKQPIEHVLGPDAAATNIKSKMKGKTITNTTSKHFITNATSKPKANDKANNKTAKQARLGKEVTTRDEKKKENAPNPQKLAQKKPATFRGEQVRSALQEIRPELSNVPSRQQDQRKEPSDTHEFSCHPHKLKKAPWEDGDFQQRGSTKPHGADLLSQAGLEDICTSPSGDADTWNTFPEAHNSVAWSESHDADVMCKDGFYYLPDDDNLGNMEQDHVSDASDDDLINVTHAVVSQNVRPHALTSKKNAVQTISGDKNAKAYVDMMDMTQGDASNHHAQVPERINHNSHSLNSTSVDMAKPTISSPFQHSVDVNNILPTSQPIQHQRQEEAESDARISSPVFITIDHHHPPFDQPLLNQRKMLGATVKFDPATKTYQSPIIEHEPRNNSSSRGTIAANNAPSKNKQVRLAGGSAPKQVQPFRHEDEDTVTLSVRQAAEPGMEGIVNVLNSIQDVIVSNISKKSEAVRADVRIARDRLLRDATADLHEMREESVGHYNNLLSLETEYANFFRKLQGGYQDMSKINEELRAKIRQTITDHDRDSLSKKMPRSLFPPLPACFLDLKR